MSKKAVAVVLILLAVLGFGGYRLLASQAAGVAGLKVVSSPTASVFLDDKLIGKTPYEDKHPPGEYVLKLIAEDTSIQAVSWQGRVALESSLLTYVRRDLGSSELTSAGEILTLQKISQGNAQVAILSAPDAVSVSIDGVDRGVTPLTVDDIEAGEHDVTVSSTGFISRTVRIQATSGYKLTVSFQLALSQTSPPPESLTPTPATGESGQTGTQEIVIKDTPTGFLRVRSSPSTAASEVAQVKPAEKYTLLEERNGWYKISYESGKEGWVSGQYAEKQGN